MSKRMKVLPAHKGEMVEVPRMDGMAISQIARNPGQTSTQINGNLVLDATDFSLLRSVLGSTTALDQDLNGNAIVDPTDLSILRANLGQPPGRSLTTP